jgi:K+-sensing histidine kinase KdpD
VAEEKGELAAEHLRKVLLVTDAALSILPLERLLDELLVRIRDALEADTAAFLLLDDEANELVARAAKGIEEEVEAGVRIPLGRGFAGRVAAQAAPIVIEDIDRADIFNPILREKGIKSLLGVPLTVSGTVIGVVHVGTLTPRVFTPDDVELLERVAERAALAIEHERLFEAEQAASDRLHRLLLVTDAALSHLSLNALLDELLLRIRDILEADTAAFLMLDDTTGELVARAAKGIEEEVERGVRIPVGRGFAGRIAAERAPVVIEDVDHADVLNPILREKGIKSLLGVPLTARGRVLGVIHVGTLTPRRFTPDDVELMQRAAERGALGVERALLYEELRRLDAVRHQFVSIASHELRTPAAAVYGAAVTLHGRRDELSPEQVDMLQETIYEQSTRLAKLIEQLLDLSRIQAKSLEINPERVGIADRLHGILDLYAGDELTLEVDEGLEADIDPVVLDRVVSNLVVNALRHGAPPVVVSARQTDRHLRISVADEGPGVPEGFRAQLFEQFTRASTTGGSGLGLAIARSYALAHGGDLLYHPGTPTGARFELVLPQPAPRERDMAR